MAKPRGLDAKLSRLRALQQEAPAREHLAELRQALRDRSNLLAAEAAEIVGSRMLSELAPDLVAAFDRFMVEPAQTDKLCRAKIAIIEALNQIEYDNADVFLRGIRHVQREARWGEPDDSAAPLRACCAFGLLHINYRDVVLVLAELLADPEKTARLAAVQALGESRAAAAIPVLRFKARLGDDDADVTAQCLAALMVVAPQESLAFVAQFLHSADEANQQAAALALGESRRSDALDVLKDHWPQARPGSLREVVLLAIAMTRQAAALDFLLEVLVADNPAEAQAALSALAIHRHNDAVGERIAAAIAKKGDAALQRSFQRTFAANKSQA